MSLAEAHGCVVSENSTDACLVDGEDWGDTLGSAFISGWFALLTIPLGMIFLVSLIVMVTTDVIRALKARKRRN
jgi:hypothetical protein